MRLTVADIDAEVERRARGEELAEEADRLSRDLRAFMYAAWPHVVPTPLVKTWHLDSFADHLQAAYERELSRLLVTVPPGFLKSTAVSVIAPVWRWTRHPEERIVSASHSDDLAVRDTSRSRALIQTTWFQARWPHVQLADGDNLKTRYTNTERGYRVRTHVGGGTGERGNVLVLDDPHNAAELHSDTQLTAAREWWGNTWASRLDSRVGDPGVKVVIGQRIAVGDVIGFILDGDPDGDRWTHLCLPLRYEPKHRYLYPRKVKLPSGRVVQGDVRRKTGELLAPTYKDEATIADDTAEMSAGTIAGQYQQLPAPAEGAIVKRHHWRYYPRELLTRAEGGDVRGLPTFARIVCSWDTTVKESQRSDYVAGTVWGRVGARSYLLRVWHERAELSRTKTAIKEVRAWVVERWPDVPLSILVELAANGPEVVAQLQREVPGITGTKPSVAADKPPQSKVIRVRACEPDFEAGQVYVPGASNGEGSYDATLTPPWVQAVIEEAAQFPTGTHDDLVDSTTQALNWLRPRDNTEGTQTSKPPAGRRAEAPKRLSSGRRVTVGRARR